MRKRYIIGVIIFTFYLGRVNAQDSLAKNFYSFERIERNVPWLCSSNGAGLIYNKTERNFSTVGTYFHHTEGEYRNYNQAKEIDNLGIFTKSYTTLKNLYFYGSFNYDYAVRNQQAWLGTVYENTNINPMLDSIPGKNIREAYKLQAKVAYKFSDLFAAGVAFDYHTATAAKRIDGRNMNTYSKLLVAPGVTFATKYLNAGINLSYGHYAEQLGYSYLGDPTGKYLCYMEGLFMYTSSPITAGGGYIKERRYEKDMFGGGVQVELKFGDFSFYNNFSAEYADENDYEGSGQITKRYASVKMLTYNYLGEFRYSLGCMDNSLRVTYSSKEDLSYNVVNNYEQVPGEVQWDYFEYGKVLRYMSQIQQYGIEYHGFVKKNEYLSKVDFTMGYTQTKSDKKEKIFPAEYNQHIKMSDFYASVNKNFVVGSSVIRVNINGGFSGGNGDPVMISNPHTTGALKLNKGVLAHDYVYKVSGSHRIGGGVSYSYGINQQKGETIHIGVNYLYRRLNNVKDEVYDFYPQFVGLEKSNRNVINVIFGFNF